MKKMTGLPRQNETKDNLQASSCGKLYKIKVKYCLSCMMVVVFILPSLFGNDTRVNGSKAGVLEAYELRISGKAEKAEELLNELLKNDSTDALAYFELARTKHHVFLGGTQFSSEEWGKVMSNLQQAVRYAPDNETYAFYYAYSCFFNAFISMMREQSDVNENIARACDAFQAVLDKHPDCYVAQLYLVDIYGSLPENIGGNKEKAAAIAADLNKKDNIFGAMANARVLPDTTNFVLYWQNTGKKCGTSAQVLEETGRAYLLKSDTENGTKYFEEAMKADASKNYLYMQLARYHLLATQQDPAAKTAHLQSATALVNKYMETCPDLVPSLKAYTYGILSILKMIDGDNNGSSEYSEMATAIDPYYSKAMGMAPDMLYCRPEDVTIKYSSFFMPF